MGLFGVGKELVWQPVTLVTIAKITVHRKHLEDLMVFALRTLIGAHLKGISSGAN